MKTFVDIPYANEYECQVLDLYLPETEEFPVFVYFHGGGIEAGDKNEGAFLAELANRGIGGVSANYRMYPEAKFPDFIEDAAKVVSWCMNNMSKYAKVKGVFVGGSSAGGYLTQMLCFDEHYLADVGVDSHDIAGYFMDAGQPTSHFNVLRERGRDSRRIIVDETAPLFFVKNGNYSPMEIVVSDNDMENRLEQSKLLYSTLKHFRNDMSKVTFTLMENSKHCEYLSWKNADGSSFFGTMVERFVNNNLK